MNGIKAGEVLHFYDHISVAVINLCAILKVGDSVHFLGHGSDFQQDIISMQIENKPVQQNWWQLKPSSLSNEVLPCIS